MTRSAHWFLAVLTLAACAPVEETDENGLADESTTAESAVTLSGTSLSSLSTTVSRTLTTSGTKDGSGTNTSGATSCGTACSNWDSVSAAIASRTIDCMGTIGPSTFTLDAKGALIPRFEKCATGDQAALTDILALLSVQAQDEGALRCIPTRWKAWRDEFMKSGVQSCPAWKKVGAINSPSEETVRKIIPTLPKLPQKGDLCTAAPHENFQMAVYYPDGKPDPRCKDAADCASKCSGGFPGLWVRGSGETAIIDPTYWLTSLDFVSDASNPFLSPGYYHPMGEYGAAPGALWGHRNREGEKCSIYTGGEHMIGVLKLSCTKAGDPSSCLTRCTL